MTPESQYSKIQRYISYLLIFALLFLNTVQVPFFEHLQAEAAANYKIVSVIVHEDVYGSISSRIKRYAEDIQSKLDNTKAIIYTVPRDITPQKIAALNEKLFYEGDGVNPSRLVGTVLVGDIPLPVVHKQEKTFLSVYPYVDFNEKNFVYSASKGYYDATQDNISDVNPEIWHSIIAPNTGDLLTDKVRLISFFDKDHDFYEKQGIFAKSLSEPYVFYYDGKRDEQVVSFTLWKGYDNYLKNIEDLTYFRYTKYLAKKLSDTFYASSTKESLDVMKSAGAANAELLNYVNSNMGNSAPDMTTTPDVMTKKVIEAVTKQFFQIFNDKYIGDILKYVYNTGRYGNSKNTRVDTVISVIAKQDNAMRRILKDTNGSMEGLVDNIVKKGLSRNIAVPVKVEESKHRRYETGIDNACDGYSTTEYSQFGGNGGVGVLENFFYGKSGGQIKEPLECSVIRGTKRTESNKSLLVEATRAQNANKNIVEGDVNLLKASPNAQTCFSNGNAQVMSFWGGYTLLNLDKDADTNKGLFPLKATDYRRATKTLYNSAGGRQIGYNNDNDTQDTVKDVSGKDITEASPNSCFEYNWLYTAPNNLNPPQGRCDSAYSNHQAPYSFNPYVGSRFEDIYKNTDDGKIYFTLAGGYNYHNRYLFLDGNRIGADKAYLLGDKGDCTNIIIHSNYFYKKISSVVEHKSPTDEEFGAQLKNMATPNLPVDRNRYVDFVSAKGNEKKFEYPNVFRIRIMDARNLNYDYAKKKLKEYLDSKSKEFNNIIASENPSSLGGLDREIYDILKVQGGQYPTDVDFYKVISENPTLLDEVVKYVLWYNLDSAELKYKYVFEHYLDTDGNSSSLDAGHKSDYEIAYLGGNGNARDMYVRLNPEKSQENLKDDSLKNIASNFSGFRSALAASKISSTSNASKSTDFKCAPPDGVPIFQWMPAIMCWLKTLVPPVTISSSSCSSSTLGQSIGVGSGNDFGGEYPALSNPKYNEDANRNGIPDGAELIKDGKIDLLSDKGMYGYNKPIKIKANLFSSPELGSKLLQVDSYSKVQFDVVKLDLYKDKKKTTVYEYAGEANPQYKDIISPYINFSPVKIPTKEGVADNAFSSKSSDVDVYLRATIITKDKDGKVAIFKKSEDLVVRVRGMRLDITPRIAGSASSSMEAGSADSIVFDIKTFNKDNEPIFNQVPITLNVYSDRGQQIGNEMSIQSASYSYKNDILKKTGTYRFVFKDKLGIESSQYISVNPAKIKEVRLTPSTTQFVKGNEIDVLLELYDQFGNRASGELYSVDGRISGKGEFSETSDSKVSKGIMEGFANFKIRNTGGAGKISLDFSVENTAAKSQTLELEVVDDAKIKLSIDNPQNIIVGGEKHKIDFSVVDGDGKPLDKLNGVAYFEIPELYGVISPNFTKIVNGKLSEDIYFIPNFVAGRNLKINVSVPGIVKVEGNNITVNPDKPMYLGLSNSKPKLEAKDGTPATLKAVLYDRYDNLVFNDSSHKVEFAVPEEFQKYASFQGTRFSETKNLDEGVSKTTIYASDLPGSAFIKAKVTPALENNSFTQKDKNGSSITIKGISENVVPFDSYYLFNKSKIDNIDFNGLYTVLQGANYGDITKPGYLGGEILFNKGGRSLAVTSLLNDPYVKNTAFGFTPGGRYIANEGASKDQTLMLEPQISTSAQGTSIDMYDSVYKDLIAKVWLNVGESSQLVNCTSNSNKDISDCRVPTDSSFIVLKGVGGVSIKEKDEALSIMMNDFDVFTVTKNGKITKDPGIKIELDTQAKGNILGMKINFNDEQIGYLGIKFKTDDISVNDTTQFPNILADHKNQLVIEQLSSDYAYDYDYLGTSSHGARGISFYRTSDSDGDSVDPVLVSNGQRTGLENYSEQAGIGWEQKNKMLLEFAGGDNIGDSTKYYHTYSMVNLGDPVISLDVKKPADSDFDRSIGKKILEEKGSPIEEFKKIDFNADGSPDIVVFYNNGYIGLLANYGGDYKDMGNLAYIADAGKGRKGVGDFTGDRYEDIAFADKNGRLNLLDNELGKFTRKLPVLLDITSKKETDIYGAIQQLEIFDMDHDGKDDLVIVDDSGELSILYAEGKNIQGYQGKNVFYKKIVDASLGLKLDSNTTKNGGAIYYDGLTQLGEPSDQNRFIQDSLNLSTNFASSLKSVTSDTSSSQETFQTLLNRLIYFQEKYQESSTGQVTQDQKEKAILSAVGTDENGNPNLDVANQIIQAQNDLQIMNASGMTNVSAINPGLLEKTRTYLRSQYGEAKSIGIEKTYKDVNGKNLQSGDQIEVTLKITNNSASTLRNIIYYDSNKNFMHPSEDGQYTIDIFGEGLKTKKLEIKDDGEFDLVFKDFSLVPGAIAIIKYNLTMPNVSFGKVIVGLLQKDDQYGDVALNPSNQCGADQVIWASIGQRDYRRGTQKFSDTSKLPDAIEKNKKDDNNNGIPDYIENLTNGATTSSGQANMAQYAQEQLDKLNIDANKNGIPDKDEDKGSEVFKFDGDSGEINIGGLDSANIDAINSGIDDTVNSLGCGFGGGACISSPLNWAPLAPGSSMTLFGMPITTGIGFVGSPSTGLPVFSAPTSCLIPVWPPCPVMAGGLFDPPMGAGFSQFRLFITPTITGAVGMAMCMGPNAASYSKAPGVDPLIPGGQCIVAAVPLAGCSDNGSDGNVKSQGYASTTSTNSTSRSGSSFINANSCTKPQDVKQTVSEQTHQNIIKYLLGDRNVAKDILQDAAVQHGGLNPENGPLLSIGGGGDDLDVNIDGSALQNLDAGSIVKVNFTRVASFPDYIMDWVTRQLEEIINKLTTLPTLYIILPDFSGFADSGWTNFTSKYKDAQKKAEANRANEKNKNEIELAKQNNNTSDKYGLGGAQKLWNSSTTTMKNISAAPLGASTDNIKAAYTVIGNLPLINIQSEVIDINVPWIEPEDLSKWIDKAVIKKQQWKDEVERARKDWTNINGENVKLLADADKLISSLDKMINTLEQYKKFPTKFRKYLSWKEHFIGQILCNLEIINKVTGGWLEENGIRFEAWVKLYVLLKAILKSWQMIIDIFADFNATCSVCHNERNNLTYWLIKLISALIPKMPVVQFPKWPDIIIDIHNIRAGLNILMPEFRFKPVPMVLPQLPDFYLPKVPVVGVSLKLPQLPELPTLPELPDLPDLPSLPTVKLPDLPPPPKIPNLFGSMQSALNLLKLVAKVLCLYRKIGQLLPPEWRAGDAIAWMTERNGTLPFDKLFIDFPQFSVPFVDAIKVTSYVNLEFDVDFIVEMAKSTLQPFNQFANDMSNLSKGYKLPDLDLRVLSPDDINVNVEVKPQSYNQKKEYDKNMTYVAMISGLVVGGLLNVVKGIQEGKKESDFNGFQEMMKKDISKLASSKNPKERAIYATLSRALDYDSTPEKIFVDEMKKKNDEKYSIVRSILENEKKENSKLLRELDEVESNKKSLSSFTPLQKLNNDAIKASATYTDDKKKQLLSSLEKNQSRFLDAVSGLGDPSKDTDQQELKAAGKDILDKVNLGLTSFQQEVASTLKADTGSTSEKRNYAAASTTSQSSGLDYGYDYQGIYVINSAGKQTRLFDYLDEVSKDSAIIELDADRDGNQDVVYKMGSSLYLKKNLKGNPQKNHFSSVESVKDIDDINDYLGTSSSSALIPFAPNFFQEQVASSNNINFSFKPSYPDKETAFRLEYYDYINRFDITNNTKQFNKSIYPYSRMNLIDLVTSSNDQDIIKKDPGFTLRKNFASIDSGVGDADIRMKDYKVLSSGAALTVQGGKTIYAGNDGLTIKYKFDGDDNFKVVSLDSRTNMEFKDTASVVILSGDMFLIYDSSKDYKGDINALKGFPVLPGMFIEFANKNGYGNIKYSSDAILTIDNGSTYEMYPLGEKSDSYSVNISRDNSFYYAKLYSFADNRKSNITSLSLLAPQFQADTEAPLIEFSEGIRIPVYQKQNMNLKKYINDTSGVSEIYVDFDVDKDSDGDGVKDNDRDSLDPKTTSGLVKGNTWYDLSVGPYDHPFKKKVLVYVKDNNNNKTSAMIDFEVYAPVPEIRSTDKSTINGSIDESIINEPVDFFRYRNGVLEKIKMKSQSNTNDRGEFSGSGESDSKGVVIKSTEGKIVATIDENTGKIDIKNPDYAVSVLPANAQNRTKLQIFNREKGNVIFEQSINLSAGQNIQEVKSYADLNSGIYFTSAQGTSLVKNSVSAPTLPGGAFIKDNGNKAIAGIGSDGNIYLLDTSAKLKYEAKDGYVSYDLIDSSGSMLGNILYKINAEYLIR